MKWSLQSSRKQPETPNKRFSGVEIPFSETVRYPDAIIGKNVYFNERIKAVKTKARQ